MQRWEQDSCSHYASCELPRNDETDSGEFSMNPSEELFGLRLNNYLDLCKRDNTLTVGFSILNGIQCKELLPHPEWLTASAFESLRRSKRIKKEPQPRTQSPRALDYYGHLHAVCHLWSEFPSLGLPHIKWRVSQSLSTWGGAAPLPAAWAYAEPWAFLSDRELLELIAESGMLAVLQNTAWTSKTILCLQEHTPWALQAWVGGPSPPQNSVLLCDQNTMKEWTGDPKGTCWGPLRTPNTLLWTFLSFFFHLFLLVGG